MPRSSIKNEKMYQDLRKKGDSKEKAARISNAAADYSFNKSHAACYGLIAYRTAYLKANYPAEYMAALISSVMSTKDRVPYYVAECESMGIEVLPPDVNSSQADFAVVDGRIRFGLTAVKKVGDGAVRAIRERLDWDRIKSRTADNDYAVAFLVLAERLGLVD